MSQLLDESTLRKQKLEHLRAAGIDPYPAKSKRTHRVEEIIKNFNQLSKTKKEVFVVGRIRLLRPHGNLTFAQLEDESGRVQIALTKKNLQHNYKLFVKLLDVGDFLEVGGIVFKTHAGEKTIEAKSVKMLAKSLMPLPDKWCGFHDTEERLRKRYLDILCNPQIKEMIYQKSIFWRATREFLEEEGFLEVETPALETTAGGASARPFVTHHNALDIDVYLRISAGELWQKKLMVAGFEKIFEIGRIFRNEGISAEHLQDYTQMEFYWAYADYEQGMKFVAKLYKHIAKKTFGTLKFKIGKHQINLANKWLIYDYGKIIKKYTGIDISKTDVTKIKQKLTELKIDYDQRGLNMVSGIDSLWKYCRKNLTGPGFLINVPVFVEPLAKRDPQNPQIVQRFQVIIAGSELGKGYSELNDPVDQEDRFRTQEKLRQAGDQEAQMQDDSFVEALKYGMPPTCGFGMSERLFAFLSNKPVRETQIFPLMKPKKNQNGAA